MSVSVIEERAMALTSLPSLIRVGFFAENPGVGCNIYGRLKNLPDTGQPGSTIDVNSAYLVRCTVLIVDETYIWNIIALIPELNYDPPVPISSQNFGI